MKKSILSLFFTFFVVMILGGSLEASAASDYTGSGFSFEASTGTLTVTTNDGTTNWQENGKAFGKSDVQSVVIGSAVTEIGIKAFQDCKKLTTVNLSENIELTTIGQQAFDGCLVLFTINLNAADKLTSIGERAFRQTIIENITIPKSVENISTGAFENCEVLKTVTFSTPMELLTIGESAFLGCKGLTSIDLSGAEKLTSIGDEAFSACENLLQVNLSNATALQTIGNKAFKDCTKLTTVDLKGADALVTIDGNAFENTGLTQITIPQSVTRLGKNSFKGVTTLEWIHFEGGFNEANMNTGVKSLSGTTAIFSNNDSSWNDYKGTNATNLNPAEKVQISSIDLASTTIEINENLSLSPTINTTATFVSASDIKWTITTEGGTGAVISNGEFKATNAGTATITATLYLQNFNDTTKVLSYVDHTQNFNIIVTTPTTPTPTPTPTPVVETSSSDDTPAEPYLKSGLRQTISAGQSLTIKSNEKISNFLAVEVNGEKLDEESFSIREEGTIVIVNGDFTRTLSKGSYRIKLIFTTGSVSTTFTIAEEFDGEITAFTPEVPVLFDDVDGDDWFYESVKYVYENGLMNGVTTTSFAPNENTTRAMVWTILARMDGVDTEGGENWYSIGQAWAIENGISDGTNPTGLITREELVTMIWRYMGSPELADYEGLTNFSDIEELATYAQKAMAWAHANGIITGKTGGILDPNGLATRAEISAMLERL